jgi:hypothetical protein
VFFSELVVPAAGGVLQWVGKKEWAQAQQNPKNGWQGGGACGFPHHGGGLGGRGSRSSGEMAASQVFRAGQDATRANVVPFPRLNRTNAQRTEWLTGEVTRRQKQPDDPVAGHLHVAASCANREGVVRGCWR